MGSESLSPAEQQERLKSAHEKFAQVFGSLLTFPGLKNKLYVALLNRVPSNVSELELEPVVNPDTATTLGFNIKSIEKNGKEQDFPFSQETDLKDGHIIWWYSKPILSALADLLNQYDKDNNKQVSPTEKIEIFQLLSAFQAVIEVISLITDDAKVKEILTSNQNKVSELMVRLFSSQAEVAEVHKLEEEKQALVAKLEEQIQVVRLQIEELEAERDRLATQLSESTAQVKVKDQKIKELEAKVAQLIEQLSQAAPQSETPSPKEQQPPASEEEPVVSSPQLVAEEVESELAQDEGMQLVEPEKLEKLSEVKAKLQQLLEKNTPVSEEEYHTLYGEYKNALEDIFGLTGEGESYFERFKGYLDAHPEVTENFLSLFAGERWNHLVVVDKKFSEQEKETLLSLMYLFLTLDHPGTGFAFDEGIFESTFSEIKAIFKGEVPSGEWVILLQRQKTLGSSFLKLLEKILLNNVDLSQKDSFLGQLQQFISLITEYQLLNLYAPDSPLTDYMWPMSGIKLFGKSYELVSFREGLREERLGLLYSLNPGLFLLNKVAFLDRQTNNQPQCDTAYFVDTTKTMTENIVKLLIKFNEDNGELGPLYQFLSSFNNTPDKMKGVLFYSDGEDVYSSKVASSLVEYIVKLQDGSLARLVQKLISQFEAQVKKEEGSVNDYIGSFKILLKQLENVVRESLIDKRTVSVAPDKVQRIMSLLGIDGTGVREKIENIKPEESRLESESALPYKGLYSNAELKVLTNVINKLLGVTAVGDRKILDLFTTHSDRLSDFKHQIKGGDHNDLTDRIYAEFFSNGKEIQLPEYSKYTKVLETVLSSEIGTFAYYGVKKEEVRGFVDTISSLERMVNFLKDNQDVKNLFQTLFPDLFKTWLKDESILHEQILQLKSILFSVIDKWLSDSSISSDPDLKLSLENLKSQFENPELKKLLEGQLAFIQSNLADLRWERDKKKWVEQNLGGGVDLASSWFAFVKLLKAEQLARTQVTRSEDDTISATAGHSLRVLKGMGYKLNTKEGENGEHFELETEAVPVDFPPFASVVVIGGPTGSGKTSALETLATAAQFGGVVPIPVKEVSLPETDIVPSMAEGHSLVKGYSLFASNVVRIAKILNSLPPTSPDKRQLVIIDEAFLGAPSEYGASLLAALITWMKQKGYMLALADHKQAEAYTLLAAADITEGTSWTYIGENHQVENGLGASQGLATLRAIGTPDIFADLVQSRLDGSVKFDDILDSLGKMEKSTENRVGSYISKELVQVFTSDDTIMKIVDKAFNILTNDFPLYDTEKYLKEGISDAIKSGGNFHDGINFYLAEIDKYNGYSDSINRTGKILEQSISVIDRFENQSFRQEILAKDPKSLSPAEKLFKLIILNQYPRDLKNRPADFYGKEEYQYLTELTNNAFGEGPILQLKDIKKMSNEEKNQAVSKLKTAWSKVKEKGILLDIMGYSFDGWINRVDGLVKALDTTKLEAQTETISQVLRLVELSMSEYFKKLGEHYKPEGLQEAYLGVVEALSLFVVDRDINVTLNEIESIHEAMHSLISKDLVPFSVARYMSSFESKWVKPKEDENLFSPIVFTGGFDPDMKMELQTDYVLQDAFWNHEQGRPQEMEGVDAVEVTGLNNNGKTSWLELNAKALVYYRLFGRVPAEQAVINPKIKHIITALDAPGTSGLDSAFTTHARDLKRVVTKMLELYKQGEGENAVVFLDEPGRNTSGQETRAIVESIITLGNLLGIKVYLTNHEGASLDDLVEDHRLRVVPLAFSHEAGSAYAHKVGERAGAESFKVARELGLPDDLVDLAEEFHKLWPVWEQLMEQGLLGSET